MELIMGIAGLLLPMGSFLLGLHLGRLVGKTPVREFREEKSLEEIQRERKRLIAEQEAFRMQMEYNADVAYGLGSSWEENPYEG